MSKDFIEKNKEVVLEEIGLSLNAMSSILASNIEGESTDGKTLVGLGYHIGNVISLFNEYGFLESGVFNKEDEDEKAIGFIKATKKDK